jgi:phosphoenolpyruvate synthase/pyruvate phosphate dikinase
MRPPAGREGIVRIVDLRLYLRMLRRQRWLILATAVIVAVAAGVFASLQTPVYTATTTVLLRPNDPTETIDQTGVGRLMEICVDDARAVNPNIKLGICGEHGGDPESVKFCHKLGLNYVSCSPKRLPVARLAAAQANITMTERDK